MTGRSTRAASVVAALPIAVLLTMAAPPRAAAQSTAITATDIQRLQDTVYDVSSDLSRLRSRDAQRASDLQTQLDDLRDEVTYLRVKLRKQGSVSRAEYTDVRNRLEDLRSQARGETPSSSIPKSDRDTAAATPDVRRTSPGASEAPVSTSRDSVIPVGTELDVRLQQTLASDTNQVEDRFVGTTLVDLQAGERVVIPAGSEMRGVVSSVNPAGRINRKGSMTVSFDQITIDGRSYPMRGTVEQALESEGVRGEAGRIGTGAGVGAIIGGILGGFKGALAGILIGGGGVVAATEGTDVKLPAGTVLRVRLDTPPKIR